MDPIVVPADDRHPDRALRLVFGVLVVSVLGLVGALILTLVLSSSNAYDPLRYSPTPRPVERIDPATEHVTVPTLPGIDGPGVRVGETVPTGGTRCVDGDDDISVVGNVWWERVDGSATMRVQVADGFATIVPAGCFPIAFENDIPASVADVVENEGIPSLWRLTGDATPTRDGGVTSVWTIEPFWVAPAGWEP